MLARYLAITPRRWARKQACSRCQHGSTRPVNARSAPLELIDAAANNYTQRMQQNTRIHLCRRARKRRFAPSSVVRNRTAGAGTTLPAAARSVASACSRWPSPLPSLTRRRCVTCHVLRRSWRPGAARELPPPAGTRLAQRAPLSRRDSGSSPRLYDSACRRRAGVRSCARRQPLACTLPHTALAAAPRARPGTR